MSAIKSMTGQAYAAGGLLGVAAAIMALTEGVAPPTVKPRRSRSRVRSGLCAHARAVERYCYGAGHVH